MFDLKHGNSLLIMPTIPENSIDCILTDSSYGFGYQSNMKKDKDMPMFYDRNLFWLPQYLYEANRVLKKDGHLYMFAPTQKIDVFKQNVESFFIIKNILVWNKRSFGMGDLQGQYAPSYEFIIFAVKEQGRKLNGNRERDVLEFNQSNHKNHPEEKPVALLEYLIKKSTNEGDVVMDSFMGSGSTGVACRNTNRNFIGIELNKRHYDCAVRRTSPTLLDMC